jgi:hypothetical protein
VSEQIGNEGGRSPGREVLVLRSEIYLKKGGARVDHWPLDFVYQLFTIHPLVWGFLGGFSYNAYTLILAVIPAKCDCVYISRNPLHLIWE